MVDLSSADNSGSMSNTMAAGTAVSDVDSGGRADDGRKDDDDGRRGESGGMGDNGGNAALVAPEDALMTAVAQVTMRRVGGALGGGK